MKLPFGFGSRNDPPEPKKNAPVEIVPPNTNASLANLEQILVVQNPQSKLDREIHRFLTVFGYAQTVDVVDIMLQGYQKIEREKYVLACVELTVTTVYDGIGLLKKFQEDYRFSRKNEHMPFLILPPYDKMDQPDEVMVVFKDRESRVWPFSRKALPLLLYKLMIERSI